jgi:hypothetical protein
MLHILCTIHTILYNMLGSSSVLASPCLPVHGMASSPEVRKVIGNTKYPEFILITIKQRSLLCLIWFYILPAVGWSRDSAVDMGTSYGLDDRWAGARFLVWATLFSYPNHPDQFQGPPSLLSDGYRGHFSWGLSGRGVTLAFNPQPARLGPCIYSPQSQGGPVIH